MKNNRVRLEDSLLGAMVKMAEGNPGAARVLAELAQKEEGIGFIHCLKLDDYGIYGPRIWMCSHRIHSTSIRASHPIALMLLILIVIVFPFFLEPFILLAFTFNICLEFVIF